MALSACGANESYDAYLAALEQHVTERYAEQGTLDALMATEYSRTILTVSMLGGDPSAFGTRPDGTTVDLLNDGVWNFAGELGAQGLNGLIFALLAVDAGTYPEPERAKNTRAGIVEAIRAAQEPDGGFGLIPGKSDVDITAMAVQALAPYRDRLETEIDAALDDRNVGRFASYLRNLSSKTQFIVITHRRGTMEAADVLYGVTMQEQGVSKVLSVDLNQVVKELNIT